MSESVPREGRPVQECPICGAKQPLSARTCSICGAVLPGERVPVVPVAARPDDAASGDRPRYDPALGDDDLYAGDLGGRMWRLLLLGGVLLALVIGLGAGVVIGQLSGDSAPGSGGGDAQVEDLTAPADGTPPSQLTPQEGTATTRTPPPTATPRAPSDVLTKTAESFRALPTVTPLPPSETPTPTPGPCYQTAAEGDTVISMAIRCGHRGMDVVDLILEINDMKSPEELQLGQTLEIPWPTPTPGPPTDVPDDATPGDSAAITGAVDVTVAESGEAAPPEATREARVNEFGTPDALAYYQDLEPTLRPGLAWHTVLAGETIMGIAYLYDTSVETLSQINPEIPFRQCDYGLQYGGPNCSVLLIEGQRIRVPVPIPTPTATPTPDGTLTPTPSPTPTYNAPYSLKPEDGAQFMADEIVTLRWGGTGRLGERERYAVRVRDLEGYETHIALVGETTFKLPGGWQPNDGRRHTFEWTVSVVVVDDDLNIVSENHQTEPRQFTWASR